MAIFDEAWVRAFQYIIADVETDFKWNLIELNPHMGIGIYQASNGESWDLLHNIVTKYPDLKSYFSDEFLKTFDSGSKRWGYKVFTNSQANQIRKCLATTNAKKVQQEMFDSFANRYIKVMKRNHITNKKGSIFASTIYHQTPKRMFQVFNAVGNAPYTRWYTGAMNNAVLRNYPSRYRKVKNFLASWDGKEIKKIPDGVSTKDWDADDIGDINPDYGSATNKNNPDRSAVSITVTNLGINSIKLISSNELWLNMNNEGNNINIRFIKQANNLWIPSNVSSTNQNELTGDEQTNNSGNNANITTKNDVLNKFTTGGKTTKKPKHGQTASGVRGKIIATMKSLEGKVSYTQASGARMRPNKGTADCSGLTWYCYKKNGYNIGTWTGDQRENGKNIHSGRCSSWKSSYEDDLMPADLFVMKHDSGGGHVEMYMDRKGYVMGIGSARVKGSRWRTITDLMNKFDSYTVRRIIDE